MSKPATQRSPHELKLVGKRAPKRRRLQRRHPIIPQRLGDRASGEDDDDAPSRKLVTALGVCDRYQISDMTLTRWLADAEFAFPQPAMRINRRRFWLQSDLDAWETKRLQREQTHRQLVTA